MNKKIMVIGGGKWQIPIIKKAKELGNYVICTNLYKDSLAFKYADKSFVVDVLDREKNLEIAYKIKPDGIITDQSDIAVKTVAYISDQLGLKGVGTDIAELYTNKFRMRKELNVKNLFHPRYKLCESLEDVIEFFNEIQNSIVIKPLSNQSSRGVFKIDSIEKLKEKFDITMSFSINNKILVEEYIGGVELTAEGFKSPDRHYTLAISIKEHYKNLPSVAKSLTYKYKFNEFDKKTLENINDNLFSKLSFGITHVEYKYYNSKFYLIEAAIRGGGTKISSHIIPVISGVDVNELLIKSVLDEEIYIKKNENKNFVILKFFDFKTGKVLKIHGIEYLINNKNIIDFDFEFKEGDFISSPNDDRSRLGYFIAYANSEEELEHIVKNIDKKVYLEYV
ncbi:ATP-grasp domain-containing protein [Hydrogenimonas thermophila]|uniref:Biotin carboxylase n=1 Tax=Hydrogenimonas thermophila TaxID=223786 RepID=A0A1I5KNR4_9BACT|nr:ATP-grasp domain-containing protein [Hydrogenimonas thermophila]SFO86719.1 Biotin carboxylase [Hydrogenimonas thermophila]